MSHRDSGNRGSRRWPVQRGGTPDRYGAGPRSAVRRELAARPSGPHSGVRRQGTGRPDGSKAVEPVVSDYPLTQFRANAGVSLDAVWRVVAPFVTSGQVRPRDLLAQGLPIVLREGPEFVQVRAELQRVGSLRPVSS
jgi:hypothetical protein